MTTEPKAMLLDVARIVGTRLSAHGFTRRGLTLLKRTGESTGLVAFQSSTASSRQLLKFTVNVGIKFECLLSERERKSVSMWDSHLSWRLGSLLVPPRHDIWWEATPGDNVLALANDMAVLIEDAALPTIDTYLDPRAAIALWESGRSPGVTDFQRLRFLERLKNSSGNSSCAGTE
jgi:hypothetical protein